MAGRIIKGIEADRAHIRGAALKVIHFILEYPRSAPHQTRKDWLAPPPLSHFRRLEPLGFGVEADDWKIFPPEECTPDLVWPLDVGFVRAKVDETLSLTRAVTVAAKAARGYADRFGPFMVRMDHGQTIHGTLATAAGLYVWSGGRWTDAQKRVLTRRGIPERGELYEDDRLMPSLATSIALRQRYEWAFSLGLENAPSIRFATDPTGIKEVFKIRDLPEGRDRRDALLTWVSDHWRQSRYDPDVELYVRKHLRGATSFTWRGMTGEIIPSQFDVEQRDKLIAEREVMRMSGTDRR